MTTLAITINGRALKPTDVRDDLTMNDFLREHLGMTGTKFGCGAAQCLSCAVIIDNPDGTSYTSPTCVVSAASFDGKAIRTVEGHAKNGELSALQKAFIEHFAFHHTHQLSLRMFNLVVQPAQYAACRTRVVVLHERNARLHLLGKFTRIEAFVEKATRIAEDFRFNDLDLGQCRSGYLDGHAT